ncbi:hypothetical protein ACNTMW_30995 [Planosporangium sp. 12N6]|uniref:hypothetical protein n=1 Tax=Planosporangium spinosum TaxID=3402278 RepID=UPI003CEEC513
MPGLTVQVDASLADNPVGAITAAVKTPSKTKGQLAAARTTYVANGSLAADEARAVGFSDAEVDDMVQPHAVAPALAPGDILDSWCVDVSGDVKDGKAYAWGHGCNVRKVMQMNGADWYVGDQISGTANDTGNFTTGHALTNFRLRNDWDSGNTVVQYSPTGVVNTSSCGTFNPSLTFDKVTVSASSQLCADNLQPTFNGSFGFGAKWNGCNAFNYNQGVAAVDVVHSPPSASLGATLYATIWWASLC